MFMRFVGQGRDVIINMDQIKEIDCNVGANIGTQDVPVFIPVIRIVIQYPQGEIQTQDGKVKAVTGMFHWDFFFNDESERLNCKASIIGALGEPRIIDTIELPELKPTK
ncbi:hypothetical protein KAR91_69335 [Candidatus Pacearchaeota archaeon]|nr:hypothetical protein [Candidatus Pacearchaeota archaeon]